MSKVDGRVLLLLASLAAGCTEITAMPAFHVTRPPSVAEDAHFEQLLAAAREQGYEPGPVQRPQRRFGLHLRYTDRYVDDYGPYRVAVTCAQGVCRVEPIGPRVEARPGDRYELPGGVRDELDGLRAAFARYSGP